jgi:hypothetical protein
LKKALIILLLISAVMGVNFVCADTESEILNGNIGFEEDDPKMGNVEANNDVENCLKEEIINRHTGLSKQVSGNGRTIGILLFVSLLAMVGIKYIKRE